MLAYGGPNGSTSFPTFFSAHNSIVWEASCSSKDLADELKRQVEVAALCAGLQVWLILDSMVLDVGRWLPEHPGGATIIPKQSLDCDCARFFEVRGPRGYGRWQAGNKGRAIAP